MNSQADIWERVLDILSKEFTSTTMETWFQDTSVVDITDDLIVISAPSEMNRNIIKKKYTEHIRAAMDELFSCDYNVLVLTPAEAKDYASRSSGDNSFVFNKDYTFSNFVVGNSNKFAYAAAKAVADQPGGNYNPLFIYGESGLGKTHLLYAIANEMYRQHPNSKIVYLKSDEFTNEMISAIRKGDNERISFQNKYRFADLFLMDDIQFIAGKTQTMEEFFNTFNSLYEAGKQIVLTADRPPKEMARMDERLVTRFEMGLLADVQPPEYETRLAIIREKAKQYGINLPSSAVEYIATNVSSNVRQLEGAVKKIMAFSDLMGEEMNSGVVVKTVEGVLRTEKNSLCPSASVIIEEVAKYYLIDEKKIRSQSRSKDTLLARQLAMKIMRDMTQMTLDEIGAEFDNRDHSTVLNSINKVEEYMRSNSGFSETVKDIKANINNRG